jgi:hypothetical protein
MPRMLDHRRQTTKRSIQGYNSSFADSIHEVTEMSMDRYHAFSTGI